MKGHFSIFPKQSIFSIFFLHQNIFFLNVENSIKKCKQPSINIKNYTAHPHDMVHVPAKFLENTSMRFRVTVRKPRDENKTWRTDRVTDGGRCNISRPGPSAWREITRASERKHGWATRLTPRWPKFPVLQRFKDPNYHCTWIWHFLIEKPIEIRYPYIKLFSVPWVLLNSDPLFNSLRSFKIPYVIARFDPVDQATYLMIIKGL